MVSKALVPHNAAEELPVDSAQVTKASKALLAHIASATKENTSKDAKKNLLQVDDEGENLAEVPIWLTLATKRHMSTSSSLQPRKLILPHPLNTDPETTICLITASPQRAYKDIIQSDEFPASLRERITRVIDFNHLQAKFKQYEAQRKLFSEHDVFLGDDRIITRLPKALGKTFYKSQLKRPIPVVLQQPRPKVDGKRVKREKGKDDINARSPTQIAKEIVSATGAALLNLSPTTNTAIKVGYASWPAADLAANITSVLQIVVDKHVLQKWNNVQAIYIKGPQTTALPIWQTEELWMEDKDVLQEGSDELKALEEKKEKANVGKKRKPADEQEDSKKSRPAKRAKGAVFPDSNDDKLDQQISDRKSRLKKQKSAAKKAMED